MQMVLPASYAVIEEEEMMYLDGGMSKLTKAGIIAAIVVVGAAVTTALVYGQFYLGAKIMGLTMKRYVKRVGAKAVATVIATNLGLTYLSVSKAIAYVAKL